MLPGDASGSGRWMWSLNPTADAALLPATRCDVKDPEDAQMGGFRDFLLDGGQVLFQGVVVIAKHGTKIPVEADGGRFQLVTNISVVDGQ